MTVLSSGLLGNAGVTLGMLPVPTGNDFGVVDEREDTSAEDGRDGKVKEKTMTGGVPVASEDVAFKGPVEVG